MSKFDPPSLCFFTDDFITELCFTHTGLEVENESLFVVIDLFIMNIPEQKLPEQSDPTHSGRSMSSPAKVITSRKRELKTRPIL